MYASVSDWVSKERRRVSAGDWDNVMLFSGVEGSGKSTWMRTIMKALDEGFNVDRIHFVLDQFLDSAPSTPRYGGVALDEARLNKRRAMHGGTIQMLDFLQDCRGLNLHIALCFPHESLLDAAVKDHRVRWNWHVTERGTVLLRHRIKKTIRTRRGPVDVFEWKTIQGFHYKDDKGTELRTAYNAKKEAHMRRLEFEANDDSDLDIQALEAAIDGIGVHDQG